MCRPKHTHTCAHKPPPTHTHTQWLLTNARDQKFNRSSVSSAYLFKTESYGSNFKCALDVHLLKAWSRVGAFGG